MRSGHRVGCRRRKAPPSQPPRRKEPSTRRAPQRPNTVRVSTAVSVTTALTAITSVNQLSRDWRWVAWRHFAIMASYSAIGIVWDFTLSKCSTSTRSGAAPGAAPSVYSRSSMVAPWRDPGSETRPQRQSDPSTIRHFHDDGLGHCRKGNSRQFAVVVWIGGVWLVTTVLLPGMKKKPQQEWIREFDAMEQRFAPPARSPFCWCC